MAKSRKKKTNTTGLNQLVHQLPSWAVDVPGVWPHWGGGHRVPMNVLYTLLHPQTNLQQEVPSEQLDHLLKGKHFPEWLQDFLMPHQRKTVCRALGRRSYHAWAPPGAGKTLIGLVWLAADPGIKLVITRASARGTWQEEIRKYTFLEPVKLLGQKPESFRPDPDAVYITAWETLAHWAPVLEKLGIGSLVMDEIHVAKNHKRVRPVIQRDGSVEFESLNNLSSAAADVTRNVSRRLGLTATPIPNRPRDLWAQLDLVEPWQWGKFHDFGIRYCEGWKDMYGWKYDGLSNTDELQKRLNVVKWRTSREDVVANLPPMRRQVVRLSQAEQNRPGAFTRAVRQVSKAGDKEQMLEVLTQEAASRKRGYITDRVTEAVKGKQKIIVFTGRREETSRLFDSISKACPKLDVWRADGSVSSEQRDRIRRDYMEHPGPCCIVATGYAMGESVNLQDTDLMLIAQLPWTPQHIEQWEGRVAGRLGQKRPVLISYVLALGTVDEHVADILLEKLPAVGELADNSMIIQLESEFTKSEGSLLSRVSAIAAQW